jgi:hypothetical protein
MIVNNSEETVENGAVLDDRVGKDDRISLLITLGEGEHGFQNGSDLASSLEGYVGATRNIHGLTIYLEDGKSGL